ncbi:MFS transporter [Pseudomonas koreensis]|uniref:MFS transporter n=1 Tax=Pseudomonas koreensis TaxID=198620 RepID=UPI0021CAB09D|nr:MFS transporter [Pseudomonas koreensis]MCU0072676.1 MFS transporter [Pseudomonas koreensis]
MDTMTENDYLIAWGLYAFAAVGCLLVWMRMTRWMWRWLREPLRVLMAVLLFSPTIIDPVKEKFAPAIAITALDLAFKVGNNAWRAISELLMYAMIAFGLYLIFVLIRFPIERASNARKEQAEAARAAARAEDERESDQPFGGAGDDRYGRPPLPSNPQRRRVEPRL